MVNKTPTGEVIKSGTKAEEMNPATLHIVEDGDVKDLNLFIRGNVDRKGPVVPRRFLSILSQGTPAEFKEGSGRRELALAITNRNNPLTARVMVNRIWGMLLGRPLVLTPSNFGHSGQPPTNPELLDDLAVRFMDRGWSVKTLIREIVSSATYRQDSSPDSQSAAAAADPSNEFFWRANRRRMTVEQWRDTILCVSGNLQRDGGKSLEVDDPANLRRTLYSRISRLKLADLLVQFDYPDANVHAEKRAVTNTATQKLFALNSPFMIRESKALAERLEKEFPEEDDARIRHAYRLLFGRAPEQEELSLGLNFLSRTNTANGMTRWQQYAQALLISNEMLYVD
jgi:hypothetical protein